jgi:hypothetical protein
VGKRFVAHRPRRGGHADCADARMVCVACDQMGASKLDQAQARLAR